MAPLAYLLSLVFPYLAQATLLYASSYAGTVTTLNLTKTTSTYSLKNISSIKACDPDPSWLTWDSSNRILYCSGEQTISGNGSLSVLAVDMNGTLALQTKQLTLNGGVNSVLYGKHNGSGNAVFIAVAHYGGSAISTFNLTTHLAPTPLQTLPFTLEHPGNGSQASPHPHQVILDPSSKFILSPDLGADLVRVFSIASDTGLLKACPALKMPAGSGPRHAAFWTPRREGKTVANQNGTSTDKAGYGAAGKMVINVRDPRRRAVPAAPATTTGTAEGQVVMYVVSELANTVAAFNVTYPPEGCMAFKEIQTSPTYDKVPKVAAAGEIAITGDVLTVSNRNDSSTFPIQRVDASDSLSVSRIAPNGSFQFMQRSPAYGSFPRQFSINKKGDMLAVVLQKDGKVAIIKRDKTGMLGDKLAEVLVGGNVTAVIWDD